jgi:hypothetical protein
MVDSESGKQHALAEEGEGAVCVLSECSADRHPAQGHAVF